MNNSVEIKIGRNKYIITKNDIFMDNRSCVQLMTQSKELASWGRRPTPKLSKRAAKEISRYEKVQMKHGYGNNVEVFTLDI